MRELGLLVMLGIIAVVCAGCGEESSVGVEDDGQQHTPIQLVDREFREPTVWGTVTIKEDSRVCLALRRTQWYGRCAICRGIKEDVIASGCADASAKWRYIEGTKHDYRLSAKIEPDGTLRYRFGIGTRVAKAYKQHHPTVGATYITAKDDYPDATTRTAGRSTSQSRATPVTTSCESLREAYARNRATAETIAEARGLSTTEMLALPESRRAIDAQRTAREQDCAWAN